MVTQLEISLINAMVKTSLIIGFAAGVCYLILLSTIVETFQKRRLLNLMKSKEDQKLLAALWLMKPVKGKK